MNWNEVAASSEFNEEVNFALAIFIAHIVLYACINWSSLNLIAPDGCV